MTKGGSLNIELYHWLGASADADPALVSDGAQLHGLHPTGFDPLRECNAFDEWSEPCPRHGHYHWLTDEECDAIFRKHGL